MRKHSSIRFDSSNSTLWMRVTLNPQRSVQTISSVLTVTFRSHLKAISRSRSFLPFLSPSSRRTFCDNYGGRHELIINIGSPLVIVVCHFLRRPKNQCFIRVWVPTAGAHYNHHLRQQIRALITGEREERERERDRQQKEKQLSER